MEELPGVHVSGTRLYTSVSSNKKEDRYALGPENHPKKKKKRFSTQGHMQTQAFIMSTERLGI